MHDPPFPPGPGDGRLYGAAPGAESRLGPGASHPGIPGRREAGAPGPGGLEPVPGGLRSGAARRSTPVQRPVSPAHDGTGELPLPVGRPPSGGIGPPSLRREAGDSALCLRGRPLFLPSARTGVRRGDGVPLGVRRQPLYPVFRPGRLAVPGGDPGARQRLRGAAEGHGEESYGGTAGAYPGPVFRACPVSSRGLGGPPCLCPPGPGEPVGGGLPSGAPETRRPGAGMRLCGGLLRSL